MSKTLVRQVSCHCWNKDGTMLALSPNTNEVWIYATNGSEDTTKWTKKYVLAEHAGFVGSLDWSPVTNQIVTSGHDRNAYVWVHDEKQDSDMHKAWKPKLVILRINRAAYEVKWSPDGNKFAVTSGAKCVPVCHYEESNSWWVSKMVKKHKSTVLTVAWCPNNKFIVTGGTDNKCRIFSAYIKGVDSAEDDGFGEVFPDQHKFGAELAEFDQGKSWVNSVDWSPSGFRLVFASHNSTISFVQIVAGSSPIVQTVRHKGLPFRGVRFVNDKAVVGAGWDNTPIVFGAGGDEANPEWTLLADLDAVTEAKKPTVVKQKSAFAAARGMFAANVNKGITVGKKSSVANTVLKTRHQNSITGLHVLPNGTITTCGIDGRVLFWHLKKTKEVASYV